MLEDNPGPVVLGYFQTRLCLSKEMGSALISHTENRWFKPRSFSNGSLAALEAGEEKWLGVMLTISTCNTMCSF